MDPINSDSGDEPFVERIAEEILERKRRGEKPSLEEYYQQYPDHEEDLRSFLPALLAVESLKPDSEDKSGSVGGALEVGGERRDYIGDYRIFREIGRGGMGVVYEAEQQALGRRVALKVVSRQATGSRKAVERFQSEARAAARMHHTNIVPVFDVGNDGEYLYYAMQLIQGQSLDLVIDDLKLMREQSQIETGSFQNNAQENSAGSRKHGIAHSLISGHFHQEQLNRSAQFPVPEDDDDDQIEPTQIMGFHPDSTGSAVLPGQSDISAADKNRDAYYHSVASIGRQTASALAYAHARGIIHRDIKPSNLLLDGAGIVWITDFGLAKTGDQDLTHTGDILGTLRYMSPERFKGQCDVRADVYSLGLSLYELLTLTPAFESADRLKLIELIADSEPPSLRAIDPRIPRDLETIILKAIDKDPRRRYQSADDMEEDLQRFLEDEPILARRTTAVERLSRWSRRNPWLATSMSIAVMALVAVATISTILAQTQSELNGEIVSKNTTLEQTIEEKEDLIGKVTAANRTNEELIRNLQKRERELKRSQARLAEKQAEVAAEKGEVAEAMLWLSLAYEMSEGQAEAVRKALLTKLSIMAEKMPRLRQEVYVPTETQSFREQLLQRQQQQSGRLQEEFEAGGAARENNTGTGTVRSGRSVGGRPAFGGNFGAGGFGGPFAGGRLGTFQPRGGIAVNVADDQPLIPFQTIGLSESEGVIGIRRAASFRFWDTRTSAWAGPAIHVDGVWGNSALHSERKRFAVQVLTPILNDDDADRATNGEPSRQFRQRTDIYNLSTGKVFSPVQSEQDSQPNTQFGRGSLMQFNADGSQLIRIFQRNPRSNAINIQRIDSETGEVLPDNEVVLKNASTGFIIPATLSTDGCRLICRQLTASDTQRPGRPRTSVACYDVFTGDQIGQSIELGTGTPLVITPDASQIAITRNVAGLTRIEVHDIESGEQVGESIELDLPPGTDVQLLNTSPDPDQSQIIVGITRRLNLTSPSGPVTLDESDETGPAGTVLQSAVQVFDLKTSRPVTPPLSTGVIASTAILSSRDQTLSVASESGVLRVWELPQSAVHPTLLPVESQRNRNGQLASLLQSVTPSGARGLGLNARFLNQIAGSPSQVTSGRNGRILTTNLDRGFALETWDQETGQLIRSAELPDLTNEFAGPLSAEGKFVFTVRPLDVEIEANQDRGGPTVIKSFRLQVRCWQTDPLQQIGTPITLEKNQAPVCISPDGNWIAIRTVNLEESGLFPGGRGAGQLRPGGFGRRFQPPTASDSDASDLTESEPELQSPPRPRLQLRHRTTGQLRRVPLGPRFTDARFSGDGRRLAVKGERTQLFDLSTESIEPIAVTPLRVSAQAPANSRGGFALGRVGLGVDVWAINFDGTLLAELVDEETLQIRQLTTGEIVGSLMDHPAAIDDVCFDLEGKKILTACADGLIRQWLLPEQWSGDAQEIQQRVEQHAGVKFIGNDLVVAQSLTDRATPGAEWLANDNHRQSTLTESQREALQQRYSQHWEKAEIALQEWSTQQPDAWLPLVLRIRPLGEQGRFEEAGKVWQQAAEKMNRETVNAWSQLDLGVLERILNATVNPRAPLNDFDPNSNQVKLIMWYHEQLQTGKGAATLAQVQHRWAQRLEENQDFNGAVRTIDQAVAVDPDSADIHFYRAHLMARLGRWDEALESRIRVMELDPKEHFHYYKVLGYHLFKKDAESFWTIWRDMRDRDKWVGSNVDRIPERLAKPALILGEPGIELEQALKLADRAYRERKEGGSDSYDIQVKGLAELRRGELELAKGNAAAAQQHFEDALEYTQQSFDLFVQGNRNAVTALAKFQEAMILHHLGRHDEARTAYLDGLDYHNVHLTSLRNSTTSVFTDWFLNEGLRRNAAELLEINEEEIEILPTNTDGWKVLFAEDFSEGISDDWTQLTGEWDVVDGAVCGLLAGSGNSNGLARLQNVHLDLPKTVEIEYETWWSEPLLSACILGELTEDVSDIVGYRVALCHMPDPSLISQGEAGGGYNVYRFLYPQGSYYCVHNHNDSLEADHRYHVRIMRTPEQLTVFVDNKQVASTWIRDQDATGLRLFARGPGGAKVYFDNLIIRAPKSE